VITGVLSKARPHFDRRTNELVFYVLVHERWAACRWPDFPEDALDRLRNLRRHRVTVSGDRSRVRDVTVST
jgi:hypothetical protein